MGAGTISTVTAFSLTAIGGGIVIWLLTFAIGSPLIAYNLGGLRTDPFESAKKFRKSLAEESE